MKFVNSANKELIDKVIADAFGLQLQSIVDTLKRPKADSKVRIIMNNSNFLIDKVIKVADEQYKNTNGSSCHKLLKIGADYKEKIKAIANL